MQLSKLVINGAINCTLERKDKTEVFLYPTTKAVISKTDYTVTMEQHVPVYMALAFGKTRIYMDRPDFSDYCDIFVGEERKVLSEEVMGILFRSFAGAMITWGDKLLCLSDNKWVMFNDDMEVILQLATERKDIGCYCVSERRLYISSLYSGKVKIVGRRLAHKREFKAEQGYIESMAYYNGMIYFVTNVSFLYQASWSHVYSVNANDIERSSDVKPRQIAFYKGLCLVKVVNETVVCVGSMWIGFHTLSGEHIQTIPFDNAENGPTNGPTGNRLWVYPSDKYLISTRGNFTLLVTWKYSFHNHKALLPHSMKKRLKQIMCIVKYHKGHLLSRVPRDILNIIIDNSLW